MFLVTSTLPRNHVKHRGVERSPSASRGKLCGFEGERSDLPKVRWPTPSPTVDPTVAQSCETVSLSIEIKRRDE